MLVPKLCVCVWIVHCFSLRRTSITNGTEINYETKVEKMRRIDEMNTKRLPLSMNTSCQWLHQISTIFFFLNNYLSLHRRHNEFTLRWMTKTREIERESIFFFTLQIFLSILFVRSFVSTTRTLDLVHNIISFFFLSALSMRCLFSICIETKNTFLLFFSLVVVWWSSIYSWFANETHI